MIRYDSNLNSALVKAVRNYNAKVARLERKGIETTAEKVSLRNIRREFQDRRDLLSYIRELRTFSKRGVERIAFIDYYKNPVSEYEIAVARSRQRRAIRMAEEKIQEAKRTTKTTGGVEELENLMGTDYVANLQANLDRLRGQSFTKRLSKTEQAKIIRSARSILNAGQTAERVRDNFFDILKKECSFAGRWPVYDEIVSKLSQLNAQSWELARNGEQTIVALIENYPRMREVKTEAEKESLRNDLQLLIDTLVRTCDKIVEYYSGENKE